VPKKQEKGEDITFDNYYLSLLSFYTTIKFYSFTFVIV